LVLNPEIIGQPVCQSAITNHIHYVYRYFRILGHEVLHLPHGPCRRRTPRTVLVYHGQIGLEHLIQPIVPFLKLTPLWTLLSAKQHHHLMVSPTGNITA
jgi:hypothetical protein